MLTVTLVGLPACLHASNFISGMQALKTLGAVFAPWWWAAAGAAFSGDARRRFPYALAYAIFFVGWIVLLIGNIGEPGVAVVGWVSYLAYAFHTAYVRHTLRAKRVRAASTAAAAMRLCGPNRYVRYQHAAQLRWA